MSMRALWFSEPTHHAFLPLVPTLVRYARVMRSGFADADAPKLPSPTRITEFESSMPDGETGALISVS